MITIFGFVRLGETGYSEVDFVRENSGPRGEIGDSELGQDILLELERTKGVHYVARENDAIRVASRDPWMEVRLHLNKAFLKVYNITPNYMYVSEKK